MISLVQRWLFGPRAIFRPDVPMMADCRRCEKLVRVRAANALATHLIYDHELMHEEAYKTVDWVFTRYWEWRREQRNGK
jgi:hypothetical protein